MSLRRRVMGMSGGGNGVFTEIVDCVSDNVRTDRIIIPVTSTDYDNILVSWAVIETGKYVDGVLVMDETPTMPYDPDGTDYVGFAGYFKTAQTYSGLRVTAADGSSIVAITDRGRSFSGKEAVRNTLQGYGGVNSGIIINQNNSVTLIAARTMCHVGQYFKRRFKFYFWDD